MASRFADVRKRDCGDNIPQLFQMLSYLRHRNPINFLLVAIETYDHDVLDFPIFSPKEFRSTSSSEDGSSS